MSTNVVSIRPEPGDDAAARERALHSLDESLVVEAAAGTGKTTVLVRRIANLLESGRAAIDSIVAVTFSHKAAGEMKLRLRQELDQRLQETGREGRPHIERSLERMEEAFIGTIHGFCAQILRERPVEAAVDPMFQELSGPEESQLFAQAFRQWFEERLGVDSPVLRRALLRPVPPGSRASTTDRLKTAGVSLKEWRDLDAPWQRPTWDREVEIDDLLRLIEEQGAALNTKREHQPVHDFVRWMTRLEQVQRRNYDVLEAKLIQLRQELRRSRAKLDTLEWRLERFRTAADRDLAPLLKDEMEGLLAGYATLKRKSGRLDFLDLLIKARDLVRDNTAVRDFLRGRFSHFFIDEFQDTDPLQAELFLLLAADDPAERDWRRVRPAPGRLFLVGDPKQSIYRFRRADVQQYQRILMQMEEGGAGVVRLSRSYRAVPAIQEFVNDAFSAEMTGDAESSQAHYVPLQKHADAIGDQPSVLLLPVLSGSPDQRFPRSEDINAAQPKAVAAFVDWLKNGSGWKVREGKDLVPVQWRHICILFRRMQSWTGDTSRDYALELEQRGIPHVLIGSKSFYEREEIMALRAAAAAIEWPEDALNVYATLRGPLFGFADADLFEYRESGGSLHPFAPRPEGGSPIFGEITVALKLLAELHKLRNRRPVVTTISLLLEAVRAQAVFSMRPGGGQVLGNVGRVLDLARNFESGSRTSFRAFLSVLEDQAAAADTDESPKVEEGADGIRIMNTHKAKGLEFPVVILADITTNLTHREPDQFVDIDRRMAAIKLLGCMPGELSDNAEAELARNRAEAIRVAYVAATRARDLLVLPAIRERSNPDWWLAPLDRTARFAEYRTCWFDRRVLDETREPAESWKNADLLSSGGGAQSGYGEWRDDRAALLKLGAEPKLNLITPSLLREPPPSSITVDSVFVPKNPDRPASRRFGLLLHAALRLAMPGRVHDIAAMQGRILGASGEEILAATDAAERVLKHPLLVQSRESPRSIREVPLTYPIDGKLLLDGVVDLAYVHNDVWVVIDFKTGELDTQFEYQVAWYAYALSQQTGLPARAVLMHV